MKIVIKENTWLPRLLVDFGWGNGYVLIPKGHPLHGKDYDEISVSVHGGLTFAQLVDEEFISVWGLDEEDEGCWCVGFDTVHWQDTLETWPEERVVAEIS